MKQSAPPARTLLDGGGGVQLEDPLVPIGRDKRPLAVGLRLGGAVHHVQSGDEPLDGYTDGQDDTHGRTAGEGGGEVARRWKAAAELLPGRRRVLAQHFNVGGILFVIFQFRYLLVHILHGRVEAACGNEGSEVVELVQRDLLAMVLDGRTERLSGALAHEGEGGTERKGEGTVHAAARLVGAEAERQSLVSLPAVPRQENQRAEGPSELKSAATPSHNRARSARRDRAQKGQTKAQGLCATRF